jgi:hypothetical protein
MLWTPAEVNTELTAELSRLERQLKDILEARSTLQGQGKELKGQLELAVARAEASEAELQATQVRLGAGRVMDTRVTGSAQATEHLMGYFERDMRVEGKTAAYACCTGISTPPRLVPPCLFDH